MVTAIETVSVFVSYAREDEQIARRLEAALRERQVEATGDWNLVRGDDYRAQLQLLIATSDVFVFLLSPDSVRSEPCREEVALAATLGKRIVPVSIRDHGDDELVPAPLRSPQWILMRSHANFDEAVAGLDTAVRTDFPLAREHRRLLIAADNWQFNQRRRGYLLRGEALRAAEHWLAQVSSQIGRFPKPTVLQSEFIVQSQRHRRTSVQQLIGAVSFAAIVLAVLAVFAYLKQLEAQKQARLATSRRLAAEGTSLISTQPDLALALAAAAWQTDPTGNGRTALLQTLQASPHLARFLHEHGSTVRAVAVSADGRTIVAGDEAGAMTWHDAATGRLLDRQLSDRGAIHALAFSRDGQWLATGYWSGSITIRDSATRAVRRSIEAGSNVLALDWNPDDTQLACGLINGNVRIIDIASGALTSQSMYAHGNGVWAVRFLNDGHLVSGGWDATIAVWDPANGSEVGPRLTGHRLGIRSLALGPDGKTLASAALDGTVRLWSVDARQAIGPALEGHAGYVESVAFSPDGRYLASASGDSTIRLWDVQKQVAAAPPLQGHRGAVWSVAFAPSGTGLVSGGSDHKILMWDLSIRHPLARPLQGPLSKGIGQLAFSRNGEWLAGAGAAGNVLLWHCLTRCEVPRVLTGHTSSVWRVAIDPSDTVVASGGTDRTVRLWDLQSGRALEPALSVPGADVYGLAFTPDGRTLVASTFDGALHFWDWRGRSGKRLDTGRRTQVGQLVITPNSRMLLASANDELILVDMTLRTLAGRIAVPGTRINAIAITPDGRRVAAGGTDKTIRLFDLPGGRESGLPLVGHKSTVQALAFDSGGNVLASAGESQELFLWDLATRRPIGPPLSGHTSTIGGLALHPTKPLLATGDWDGHVLAWELDGDRWAAVACRVAGRMLSEGERAQYLGDRDSAQTCNGGSLLESWALPGSTLALRRVERATLPPEQGVTVSVIDVLKAAVNRLAQEKARASAASAVSGNR
ncbi:TIR domain-containing protein [Aquincola sp. S2]|uniref:TIR domain-containing protein n=1 Tax=Pseudaquabacterium terrae TaxID=2732868 RepID=A0ABX2ERJ0_9BURK|nr:TIR domain-containing protein [Aquabacterium terrae]NRF71228.1 TIR domain-containing protein [Aquabacterium terrae]